MTKLHRPSVYPEPMQLVPPGVVVLVHICFHIYNSPTQVVSLVICDAMIKNGEFLSGFALCFV